MKRVGMYPYDFHTEESGIRRVVEAYRRYLPRYGWQVVDPTKEDYDLLASHAGTYPSVHVAHCHGLYWTADYPAASQEWKVNENVVQSVRMARQVTVPSRWVAEVFQRDMRFTPHVISHGIEWQDWRHTRPNEGYVLWNKNRSGLDVCDPSIITPLALAHPSVIFYTTFAPKDAPGNVHEIGRKPHHEMKKIIQEAAIYLGTTKETFGIGLLEAMASGVPILGFNHGGNTEIVEHGVNGFLATPGDLQGLIDGLSYCMRYRKILGANGAEMVKRWTWDAAAKQVSDVYEMAMQIEKPTVSIVIPTYNYGEKVGRAIESALRQVGDHVSEIIVVDDGSTDNGFTANVVGEFSNRDRRVRYIAQPNSGVANARNRGVSEAHGKYIVCLDADDAIEPQFVDACLAELERDPSLGIAYTGLRYIKPDGTTGISDWPSGFDYDQQLERHNQVPTCCMFRREMWARLGGYKQRYAPMGAGSEDAEFFLRAGAYGWNAKKVTEAGLFVYSWMSGRVSGNPSYSEVDWTAWHPWTKDDQHPFASLATPRRFSHPVRQYDEPTVSVVIPVGPNHTKEVVNALDSLEAQTLRKWEAIVVFDGKADKEIMRPYPYARIIETGEVRGAGYARNRGIEIARAPLVLFLDADDWLYPEALDKLYDQWTFSQDIVYSDYVGKAYISEEEAERLRGVGRLLYYNERNQEAVISHKSSDYDYARAVRQPDERDMYIWNLITSLVPKAWHKEIGGFDESMESWEDWDYWIRMARRGKSFTRLAEPLVVYRFATGSRREFGLQEYGNLLEYLRRKYERMEIMPCTSCGGNRMPQPTVETAAQRTVLPGSSVSDDDFVLVQYNSPNRGAHRIIGAATGTFYGYRGGGARFYADRRDVAAQPDIYQVLQDVQTVATPTTEPPPPPKNMTAAPEPKIEESKAPEETFSVMATLETTDLQTVPGVSSTVARQLNELGIHNVAELLDLDKETLISLKGVGPARAANILAYLNTLREKV